MKRYKTSDIFEGNNKNVNYYKTEFGSVVKIERVYHKDGKYTDYRVFRFSTKDEKWHRRGILNQYQLIEQCKNWEHITSAEAFIEIL